MKSFSIFFFCLFVLSFADDVSEVKIRTSMFPYPRDGFVMSNSIPFEKINSHNCDDNNGFLIGGGIQNFSTQSISNPNGNYQCFNDVWMATTSNKKIWWHQVSTTGTFPCRSFAGGDVVEDGSCGSKGIFVYGGDEYLGEYLINPRYDAFYKLDLDNYQWVNLSYITPNPGPRDAPFVVGYEGQLYVFGGVDPSFSVKNDLWRFNTSSSSWTQLHSGYGMPGKFAGAVGILMIDDEPHIVVTMGRGVTFGLDSSTWLWSINDNAWINGTPSNSSDNIPFGRTYPWYSVTRRGDELILGGGDDGSNNTLCGKISGDTTAKSDIWSYDSVMRKWVQYSFRMSDDVPNGMKYGGAFRTCNNIYFGFGFGCNGNNQVFNKKNYVYKS